MNTGHDHPVEQAAALLDEAGAPLLWALVVFIVIAIVVMAGALS